MARPPTADIDRLQPIALALHRHQHIPAREIARRLGLARGTVAAILSGRRTAATTRAARKATTTSYPRQRKWCNTCQRLTPSPCVICAARAWRRESNLPL